MSAYSWKSCRPLQRKRPSDFLSLLENYHYCIVLLKYLRFWHQRYTITLKLQCHRVVHNQLLLKAVGSVGLTEDGGRTDGPGLEAANSQSYNERLSCQAMSQFFSCWAIILISSIIMSYTIVLPNIYYMPPGQAASVPAEIKYS